MGGFDHKYLYAENRIKDFIRYSDIDTKLDGERVLAKDFGISYMTLRRAVDNLVADGVLYKIPRKGTFVANRQHI